VNPADVADLSCAALLAAVLIAVLAHHRLMIREMRNGRKLR